MCEKYDDPTEAEIEAFIELPVSLTAKEWALLDSIDPRQPSHAQPDFKHLWDAYVAGARSGQKHPNVSDKIINKSADAYCKWVHAEIDPVMFQQLGGDGA